MISRRHIDARMDELESYTTHVYDDLFKYIRLIEYKLWQFNNATNLIIYNDILSRGKKRKDFHPLVSIIIPAYNGEKYLHEAIDCALAQDYDNCEIIVINDGSTDGTEKIAKSYGNKIRYYKKPNGGVSSALNLGIKKMRGDYFAWLSHDDLIAKDHIRHLVDWVSIEGHEQDIPFSSFRIVDEKGHLNLPDTITAELHYNDFKISYAHNELSLLQGEINGGSVLIPREAFAECGTFNEDLRISQERDMWSRLIKKYHFVNIPFDTASIRIHSKRVTSTSKNIDTETDAKTLEILENIDLATMERLFGNKIAFYENVKYFYDNHNKKVLSEAVATKLSELKN